jgi:hypothetical protein
MPQDLQQIMNENVDLLDLLLTVSEYVFSRICQ